MASPVVSERFRAVVCRHCGKPIRVPALVTRRESEFQGLSDSGSMQHQLISRVFNVRCRSCERESGSVSAALHGCASSFFSLILIFCSSR